MSELLRLLYRGNRDEADALLASDPPPTLDIFEAAAAGDAGRVKDLVAADAALAMAWTDDGFTALHYACFFGTAEAAVALLDAGAAPNVASRNEMAVRPINSAAAGREAAVIVRALLDHGADVDGRQASGHSALDEARLNADAKLIELLLVSGAKG